MIEKHKYGVIADNALESFLYIHRLDFPIYLYSVFTVERNDDLIIRDWKGASKKIKKSLKASPANIILIRDKPLPEGRLWP